ncbi:hypothetical protein SAY86_010520 [Trapa natans]|uniref:Uncharacterized protein n=1 Tax=Trapa natans TaxID=22666 RepID=A0AAN7LH90_TRANT|nr:hypothetical protein SAY86_010520 [Trapa natans]
MFLSFVFVGLCFHCSFSFPCEVQFSGSQNQVANTAKQSLPHNQQNQHPSTAGSGSLAKGQTLLDEFKIGFPSEGLSVISNKWWGCNSGDEDETKKESEHKFDDLPTEMKSDEENEGNNLDLSGTNLLTAVRRKATAEGEKALKIGVFRGRSIQDMGDRERALLLGLFQSSFPKDWIEDYPKL